MHPLPCLGSGCFFVNLLPRWPLCEGRNQISYSVHIYSVYVLSIYTQYIFLYIYVYIYIHMGAYMYVCEYLYICLYVYICVLCMYTCIYVPGPCAQPLLPIAFSLCHAVHALPDCDMRCHCAPCCDVLSHSVLCCSTLRYDVDA